MSDYKIYCPNHYKEIENYELALKDNFVGWICHHRNGEEFSTEWLIQNNMYYDREDPHEFRFVPVNRKLSKKYGIPSHMEIHNRNKDYSFTQTKEYKNKISDSCSGTNNGMYGKHHSKETKDKIRKVLITNGSCAGEKNGMYGKHHTKETIKKQCKPKTEFGRKFYEHYNIERITKDNKHLYDVERSFFLKHGHCSWEA